MRGQVAIVLVGVALVYGCGKDEPPANTGQPPPQQCGPGQFFNGQTCQAQAGYAPTGPTQPAPGPTTMGTGSAPPPPPPIATGSTGPSAMPADPAMSSTVAALLTPLGQSHAPAGAKAVGSPIVGQFQQGQSLEAQVMMNPGKCYTVVGVGMPPIQNVDLQILPTIGIPGLPSPLLATDQTQGPNAVIGDKPNCFKWAFPMAAVVKVVLTVSSGQGVAAAQVFEK
ncbi:MAG: hypothetical protein SFV15_23440 [Polyangiaceae bacterium]|nr:hypothetical protein [Polyangiaceae bacterium]